jgi:uncharacterized membrane protein
MIILVVGLILFLGSHLVPVVPSLRNALRERFGENGYKGAFSAASGLGLLLVVAGYAMAPRGEQWLTPSPAAIRLAPEVMMVSFILLAAANMKGYIRTWVQHPMLLGVGLWSAMHLLANGHAKATILFGAFLLYAVIDLGSAVSRRAVKSFAPQTKHDVIAVVAGIVLVLVVSTVHRLLFGVKVVPWGF